MAKALVRSMGRPRWLWAKANMPAPVVLSLATAPSGGKLSPLKMATERPFHSGRASKPR